MNNFGRKIPFFNSIFNSFIHTKNDQKGWFSKDLGISKKRRKILTIIDSAVDDYQTLAAGIQAGTQVYILNSFQDGIAQITQFLATQREIDSLQIVAHGAEGTLKLGSTELNSQNLDSYSQLLQKWNASFKSSADILLVACNVAAGESGPGFVRKLSQLTEANIAASRNLIGSSKKGGNWNLEFTLGPIGSSVAFKKEVLEAYGFVLATLIDETFKESAVFGPWIYGVSGASANPGLTAGTGSGVLPGLGTSDVAGNGALRLTSNATNQSAFVIYNNPIPATSGLEVTFDFFAYQGAGFGGGDGLSFFLIDGAATPTQAGGFGSSLGYSRNTDGGGTPGIEGGYVGIGFDEYGNFARAFQKGPPSSDPTPIAGINGYAAEPAAEVPDTVTIRGRENPSAPGTGYNYITQTSVPGGIDNYAALTRDSAKRSVLVRLEPSPSNRLTVSFDFNNNGVYTDVNETIIDIPNITTINGPVPTTFKFGFASSTGGATNIHEVQRLVVKTINPPPAEADVVTTKIGPAFVTPGGNIAYTITATNTSLTTDATNVLIQDQLPTGLTFVSAPEGGIFNATTGVVSWPTITLPANQTVNYTLNVTAPAAGGPFTNKVFSSATTFDPTPGNNNGISANAQVTTEIVPAAADVVTGKVGPATITAGAPITYTITAQNNGPSPATNVVITDNLPIGLTGVTLSDSGTYDPATGQVTFPTIATLNSGAANAVTRTISFTVPPTLSTIVNTVSSTSDTPDPTPNNNNGTTNGSATTPGGKVTTTVNPSADVVTGKVGPATITVGQPITYTVTTQNNGPSPATNVVITDNLPIGLTGVTISDSGTYDAATGKVTFPAIATLNSGAANAVTRTISFTVPPTLSSIVNTVSSTSDTPDPTLDNNNGTTNGSATTPGGKVTTTVNPSADVVTGKVGPATITVGQPITYTITTQNNGPSPATNVVITDNLPIGLTGVTISDGGTYDAVTGKVTFQPIATLNSGAANAVTRTISFTVPPTLSSIVNTVSSTSDTPDPTPDNNNGTTSGSATTPGGKVSTTINSSADVVTTKTGVTTATAGTPVTYTITTKNNGPSAADNVVIVDNLPPGLSLSDITASDGGSYDPATGVLTFPIIPSLASGSSITRTLTVKVPASGSISNRASSTSITPDPVPDNNNGTKDANVTTTSTPSATPTPEPSVANQPPIANNTNVGIQPNSAVNLTGLGGFDPDGTIAFFTITTLPPSSQGTLYLGDPANGGIPIQPGQVLTPAQISQIFFQSTGTFSGASFNYTATDTKGATSPAAATVSAIPVAPNIPPVVNNTNSIVSPNSTLNLKGLGGADADGTIASFTIDSLPPAAQGILFLGDPANGGVPIQPGQVLTPDQISQLFFQSTGTFKGASFTYSTTDNQGKVSPSPATVSLLPSAAANQPPNAQDVNASGVPNSVIKVDGLSGSDPDGTIASFTIDTLPPTNQGVLFLGNPTGGGTPIQPGQILAPSQVSQVFFQSTGSFTGASFTYSTTDNAGAPSPLPATVNIGATPVPTPTPTPNPTPTPTPTTPTPSPISQPTPTLSPPSLPSPTPTPALTPEPTPTPTPTAVPVPTPTPTPLTVPLTLVAEPEGGCPCPPIPEKPQFIFGSTPQQSQVNLQSPIGKPSEVSIKGTPEDDLQSGTDASEDFVGSESSDRFLGEGGPDLIYAREAGDNVWGGQSEDVVYSGKGNDIVYGGKGGDWIEGDLESDTLYGDRGPDTLIGGDNDSFADGDDVLFGGDSNDVALGSEGNDTVHAGKDDDIAYGGKNSDLMWGELGADILSGDEDEDTLYGDIPDSQSQKAGGRDRLFGGSGNDWMNGEEDNDSVLGGNGSDRAYGGKGEDLISGEQGADTLYGGLSNDVVVGDYGRSLSVAITGEEDFLFGNEGDDTMGGGEGNDNFYAGKGPDLVYGGKDGDLMFGDKEGDTLVGDQGNDTLYGGNQDSSNPDVTGDVLFGDEGDDWLSANDGEDSLVGGAGNDNLFGGKGNDTIHGNAGDDLMYGDEGRDKLCGGDGNDTIFGDNDGTSLVGGAATQGDCIHGGAGDDLIYSNEGDDVVEAEDGNDTILGGKGNDLLFGRAGDDWLVGDLGSDSLIGGIGSDRFILGPTTGSDIIYNFEVGLDKIALIGGLNPNQVTIEQTLNSAVLRDTATSQVLATVVGFTGAITPADLIVV